MLYRATYQSKRSTGAGYKPGPEFVVYWYEKPSDLDIELFWQDVVRDHLNARSLTNVYFPDGVQLVVGDV